MSIIDTLIFDRTQADVSSLETLLDQVRAGAITEEGWAILNDPTHKGAYNYTDLNRVTEAMEYLKGRLEGYGYLVPGYKRIEVPHKEPDDGKDPYLWYEADIPTPALMAEYLGNVQSLKVVLELFQTTPAVPEDMERLTVEEANAIEKILADVETAIIQIVGSFVRSDAFTALSGNRPLPSSDSDKGRTWEELDGMQTTWANWNAADWFLLLYGNLIAEAEV